MGDLNPKKILVIRPDAIGDCVYLIPLLNVLKDKWPRAKIYLLASSYTKPLFEKHQSVDFVICDYLKKGKSFFKYYRFYKELKKEKFNIVIHSFNVFSYSFLSWLAKIPVRVGDRGKIGPNIFHNYKARQKFIDLTHHEVELNLDLLEPLGIKDYNVRLNLVLPDVIEVSSYIVNIIKSMGKFICIHLGTGGGNKAWLAEGYVNLIRKIIKGGYGKVVLIGADVKEKEMSEVICKEVDEVVINLVGQTNIRDLVWLISKSKMFLGVDSGPMHIASALKIPVLALAPTNFVKPTRWGPFQTNNLIVRPDVNCNKPCFPYKCKDDFCLKSITVDSVFNLFLSLYNQKTKNSEDDNLLLWLKASLNILLTLESEKERENLERVIKILSLDGWSFDILVANPRFKIKLFKKGIRLNICLLKFSLFNIKSFLKLYSFIIKNDINLVHHFGKRHGLFFRILFALTALRQYLPPKIMFNKNKAFESSEELIENYIKLLQG